MQRRPRSKTTTTTLFSFCFANIHFFYIFHLTYLYISISIHYSQVWSLHRGNPNTPEETSRYPNQPTNHHFHSPYCFPPRKRIETLRHKNCTSINPFDLYNKLHIINNISNLPASEFPFTFFQLMFFVRFSVLHFTA